jgi:hypothetical protein
MTKPASRYLVASAKLFLLGLVCGRSAVHS